ncbi:phage GP46 family protein [Paraburkholderia tropica]|uniref:phage GP46 family protein n=1 Tax=Paraburkholderia tropica TaxID=92647 RepID=UPI002AB62771|nr:phage GP46 family protein [Paraburkholderia tropica]
MSDIKIYWDAANGRGDWRLLANDIATGDDLETALLFSLFSDREAASDDTIPDESTDRRGWWGDDGSDSDTRLTGSRLWLLARRKAPEDSTLQDAYDYIVEAIQWLIDDDVVGQFDVTVQWQQLGTRKNMIGASIVAWPPDGSAARTYNWAWGTS